MTDAVVQQPGDRERLRAALRRLGTQETDPGVWDDLAAENAALAPARTRATKALLAEGDPKPDPPSASPTSSPPPTAVRWGGR